MSSLPVIQERSKGSSKPVFKFSKKADDIEIFHPEFCSDLNTHFSNWNAQKGLCYRGGDSRISVIQDTAALPYCYRYSDHSLSKKRPLFILVLLEGV